MRYDGRCRFGTYAEAVIFERYLRRWTDLRDYNEQVKSLDGLQDVVGDFVEDRPETASTTSEALEDVFRMHAPYATRRERDVLIAYLGLDGDRRQKLREIGARLQLCNERIRQIAETALNNARAYKRGAAGRRLGNQS
jgi:DNA-directed RNA polymerase sigma subunit (sigma70/sigma32)